MASRKINPISCKICGFTTSTNGIATHIKSSHDISSDDYIKLYGEYRPNKLAVISRHKDKPYNFVCLICNMKFQTNKQMLHHVITSHSIYSLDYIKTYILAGNDYKCKCGCGQLTKIYKQPPYYHQFITGHNSKGSNNGMYGRSHESSSKQKMANKAILRIGKSNKINTKPELQFELFLQSHNIKYEKQKITDIGSVDFYLADLDLYVEIDGEYWHPTKNINLNFQLLTNKINDNKKNIAIPNLCRIPATTIHNLQINNLSATYNEITPLFYDKILTKEYLRYYIDKHGKKKIARYITLLLKFIREFQPELPTFESYETLQDVVDYIKTNKPKLQHILLDNTFQANKCYHIGVTYLKSIFNSYWDSRFKRNITPREAWNNDNIMRDIIMYRIGLNEQNEVFDFSLHQLIRGLSANRITISFFKPVLAAAIYYHFLGDNPTPIVIDPCAGFGGRMVGFKSLYPDGTYIGIEPNTETYNELVLLASNFKNVKLYNSTIEDFNINDINADLTFTSIPYSDTEIYSDTTQNLSMDYWKNTVIPKLNLYPNLLVNIPIRIHHLFPDSTDIYHISNNSSHFAKTTKQKKELLLKFY